jgi:hypothetical protein
MHSILSSGKAFEVEAEGVYTQYMTEAATEGQRSQGSKDEASIAIVPILE